MADYTFSPGSIDNTVYVFISGGATGGTLSVASQTRRRQAATSFIGSQLAAANSAHTDGGWKEVAGGSEGVLYRVDLPDAATAIDSPSVEVYIRDNGNKSGHVTVAIEPSISPFLVDKDHTWFFNSRSQITASNNITEHVGFVGLLAMDFTGSIPAQDSIASLESASVADVVGATEPTMTGSTIGADQKTIHLNVNASAATAGTYTFTVRIITVDGQTFERKGRLVLQ